MKLFHKQLWSDFSHWDVGWSCYGRSTRLRKWLKKYLSKTRRRFSRRFLKDEQNYE